MGTLCLPSFYFDQESFWHQEKREQTKQMQEKINETKDSVSFIF